MPKKKKQEVTLGPDAEALREKLQLAKPLINAMHNAPNDQIKDKFIENFGDQQKLCELLGTHPENGIPDTDLEVEARKAVFGQNIFRRRRPMSYCQILFTYFKDPTIIILTVISMVILVSQIIHIVLKLNKGTNEKLSTDDIVELVEPALIIGVVLLVLNITTYNDWKRLQDQQKLQDSVDQSTSVNVIRAGKLIQINSAELVVGDLVEVNYGNIFQADGIIASVNSLVVDQSVLTGESDPKGKSPQGDCLVLSSTHVIDGSGKFIVTAVGHKSFTGKINKMLGLLEKDADEDDDGGDIVAENVQTINKESKTAEQGKDTTTKDEPVGIVKSPLQVKQSRLSSSLTLFTSIIAAIVLIIRIVLFFVKEYDGTKDDKAWQITTGILKAFQLAVTVIVVGIPEGILIATTMTATIARKRMMKDDVLVNDPNACETMGNVTIICSDKTGTLTQNMMTVIKMFYDQELHSVSSIKEKKSLSDAYLETLADAIAYNTALTSSIKPFVAGENLDSAKEAAKKINPLTAQILGKFNAEAQNINQKAPMFRQEGNKTDCAFLGLASDLGRDVVDSRREKQKDILKIHSFNSERKSMSAFVDDKAGGVILYVKGASEVLVSKSSKILTREGKERDFEDNEREDLVNLIILPLARQGLRTLTVAYRKFPDKSVLDIEDESQIYRDLVIVTIVGIEDPIRPEVKTCISTANKAGVRVIMVTGDNLETAKAISQQCGIYHNYEKEVFLTSKEFNERIRDDKGEVKAELFEPMAPYLCGIARSQPSDKQTLVELLKDKDTVAVTGDGTNDAPALRAADIGFAMGMTGTDVAKGAADMVLLDDNFTTVLKVLVWGRNMYDSIAKFLQFQLFVNFTVLLIILATVIVDKYPCRALPLLWVNLLMDLCASLALGTEFPHKEQLDRKPYSRTTSLISMEMFRKMLCHVIYQAVIIITLFYTFQYYGLNLLWENNQVEGIKMEEIVFSKCEGDCKTTSMFRNTFIFNTFIMLILFNEINSRTVMGERNVFQRCCMNKMFSIIWVVTFVLNIVFVTWVGDYIGLYSLRRLGAGNAASVLFVSLLIGLTSLIWEQISLFLLPNSCLRRYKVTEESEVDMGPKKGDQSGKLISGYVRGHSRLQVSRSMRTDSERFSRGSKFMRSKTVSERPS